MERRRRSLGCCLIALGVLSSGCSEMVVPPATDPTPPTLHLGTAGLQPDIEVESAVGQAAKARVSLSADVLIGAQAEDAESGVRSVDMTLDTSVTCGDDQTASHSQTAITMQTDAPTGATLPLTLNGLQTLKGVDVRHLCPAGKLLAVVVAARATAVNGLGASVTSPTLTLTFDGDPDKLKMVLLNLFRPGLAQDDGSDVGQPVPGSDPPVVKAEVGPVLDDLARTYLAGADLVFLTEIVHRPHVERLSQVSGLPYLAVFQDEDYTDVALLSRYPLGDVSVMSEADLIDGANAIRLLSATMSVGSSRFLVLVSHFPARAGQEARKKAYSNKIDAMVAAQSLPAFIGGDFNNGYPSPFPDASAACMDDQRLFVATSAFAPEGPATCQKASFGDHPVVEVTLSRK
jgi:hypothetical protein